MLFTEADKQAFQVMLIGMVICIAAGFYSYSSAKAVPLGKIIWKMSPDKGERLIYRFNDDSFFFVREGAETQIAYSALYRLCEDKERFYLLLGKMEGYILPKRDIPVNLIREFQCFMENVTDLPMEQC